MEEHVRFGRHDLTLFGIFNDFLGEEILVVEFQIDALGEFEGVGSIDIPIIRIQFSRRGVCIIIGITTTSAAAGFGGRLFVRAGFF